MVEVQGEDELENWLDEVGERVTGGLVIRVIDERRIATKSAR